MANPTSSQRHFDVPLTNLAIAYMQDPATYVADRVAAIVPVEKRSNKYVIYDQGDFLRIEAGRRAPATESVGGGYRLSTDSYYCERYALHVDIADEDRKNTDAGIDDDADATAYITQQLRLKREDLFATAFFGTGIWTGDQTGASSAGTNQFKQWDLSGSTPVADIKAQARTMQGRTGLRPNKLVVGRTVYDALLENADIKARVQYVMRTTGREVGSVLAEMFDVDEVLVADAVKNTANEGATASYSRILGNAALLLHVNQNAGARGPSSVKCFSFSDFDRVKQTGAPAMKRIRIEEREADRIEGDIYCAYKVTAVDLGVYFTSALSA